MQLPSWESYSDMYTAMLALAGIFLYIIYHKLTDRTPPRLTPEEEKAKGLPFYTEPNYWRTAITFPIMFVGSLFNAAAFGNGPYIIHLLSYVPLVIIVYFLTFGGGIIEKQAAWDRDDKLERQKHVAAAAHEAQVAAHAAKVEDDRLRAEAREASFPSATPPTPSATDITETARALAKKLS